MMANFNLNDYETVEERIRRFYKDNPDARITTELVSADGDPGRTRWIVKAYVFRDSERDKPDATGYAFEVDGSGMTQKAAALETCETSAIGRALANLNYSGNKRASREEMAKVQRQQGPSKDWVGLAGKAETKDQLRVVWNEAKADGAPQEMLDRIAQMGQEKAA